MISTTRPEFCTCTRHGFSTRSNSSVLWKEKKLATHKVCCTAYLCSLAAYINWLNTNFLFGVLVCKTQGSLLKCK